MAVKNTINPVKFESDLLKTNEDKALQSHRILQAFVWWEASPVPLTIQTSVKFAPLWSNIFALFGHITFKLGKFRNFKALLTEVLMDISL